MTERRVLVTGSSGFIGRHLVRDLKRRKPRTVVVGLDRRIDTMSQCDDFVQVDLLDDTLEKRIGGARFDHVIHLAALCKEPGYPWRDYFTVNHEGTRRLTEWMARTGSPSLLFTSTMMVFAPGRFRRTEADIVDPDTAYGASKALAEVCATGWARSSAGRRLRVVRPGVVFGPGDEGNMLRLIKALHGRRFAYIGRRDTIKGCIYVKDLVDLLIHLMDDDGPHETYHAVFPEPTPVARIVESICTAWNLRRSPPTIPFSAALALATPFALIDPLGNRFGVHPRRIQKLFADTHIGADRLTDIRWQPRFSLQQAFQDWRHDEDPMAT